MKKSTWVAMILGTVGGVLFALGMCMALLPEWGLFSQGVACGAAGLVVLLIDLLVWRRMEGKAPIRITLKALGTAAVGVLGALLLGGGYVPVDGVRQHGAGHPGGASGHCAAALPDPGGERSGVNQSTRALLAVLPGCFCL